MFWLFSRIAFVVAAFLPAAAFAGYAQLVPPPAFQPVGPGVTTIPATVPANNFIYDVGPERKAVIRSAPMQINDYPFDNRAKYRAGFVGTRASLNVGTRTVGVPVAFRVAGGAARFAVAAFNPWVAGAQLALLAVPFVLDWFSSNPDSGLTVQDGYIRGTVPDNNPWGTWGDYVSPAGKFAGQSVEQQKTFLINEGVSFANLHEISGPHLSYEMNAWTCSGFPSGPYYANWYVLSPMDKWGGSGGMPPICLSPAVPGSVMPVAPDPETVAVTNQMFEVMAQYALDVQALAEQDIALLVDDLPIINPAALPEGQVKIGETNPAPELLPRPIRYPNGNPVLIPGTEPPLYTQPWYEVTGAPTVDNPWRVNIAHVTTTTTDPTPVGDPTDPVEPPPPPFDFYTDCDKFPGSVGCAAVGSPPDVETMPEQTRTIGAISGPSFSGEGCPSNLNIAFAGHSFQVVDMSIPCGWISGLVKPIFILLSFITAVFIVRSAL